MRTFGAMALGGLAGLVVLKLLGALLLPLFGMAFGLFGLLMKVKLWIAIGYLVYTLLRGRRGRSAQA